jgi:hypothetical protein
MFRLLAPALAALALLAAGPALAQGRPSTAEQEFGRLNADRAHLMGLQQYRLHRYDAALRHFEKAVALAPEVDAYRHSLALTKQRIAINKTNQKRVQDNLNRARKGLAAEQSLDDAREFEDDEDPYGLDAAGSRVGGTGVGRDTARGRSVDVQGRRVGNDDPAVTSDGGVGDATRQLHLGGDGVGDAARELHLGGDGDRSGLPRDLPVAGSGTYDLPVGRLPKEPMLALPTPGRGAGVLPLSGGTSMFPFLDPASETPSTDRVPASPRLDRPESLP